MIDVTLRFGMLQYERLPTDKRKEGMVFVDFLVVTSCNRPSDAVVSFSFNNQTSEIGGWIGLDRCIGEEPTETSFGNYN